MTGTGKKLLWWDVRPQLQLLHTSVCEGTSTKPPSSDSWRTEDRQNTAASPPLPAHGRRTSPPPPGKCLPPATPLQASLAKSAGPHLRTTGWLVASPHQQQHQDSEARPKVRKIRSLLQNHSKITLQQYLPHIAKHCSGPAPPLETVYCIKWHFKNSVGTFEVHVSFPLKVRGSINSSGGLAAFWYRADGWC